MYEHLIVENGLYGVLIIYKAEHQCRTDVDKLDKVTYYYRFVE